MERYHLAIDIGASGGRHILGHLVNGKIKLEEVYRFPNGMESIDGHKCWNMEKLFYHVLEGLKKCRDLGKIPETMGIDTWGVDFVLLDESGDLIGNAVGYRDGRTEGMDEKVKAFISEEELYKRTGIQKQPFNTIYQLMYLKEKEPDKLKQGKRLLMIPEYLNFLLTDIKMSEYTNATTTGLVNAEKKDWDFEIINALGFPEGIFGELNMPGTCIGGFSKKIKDEVGFDIKVILVATHDTASAVMAVPAWKGDVVYISSGTWSLMGTECDAPDCSFKSRKDNFTNEGGYEYRFRYLKNIMGLWMIQSVKSELAPDLSYGELCKMASLEKINSIVDCNDSRFLAPKSMTEEIKKACEETGQQVPQSLSQVASVVYNSLAKCYGDVFSRLSEIKRHDFKCIHVIGGGANAEYLNSLTAEHTERTVLTGPVEATAIGNIICQMISAREFDSLSKARESVFESFEIKEYKPAKI